jgi:hypothetical protein
MVRTFTSTSCVALLFAFQTQAATVTTGDGVVFPASGEQGGEIQAGFGGTGSVKIDGGDTVTITSGTSSDELVARPKIDIGDNGTGTVTITGLGTTVNLNGTNSGSKLEVGTYIGSSGTLEVLDGATINLWDDGPLSGDGNENIFLQFGEDQADGTLTMDNGTINATGYSRVGMLVGVAGNTPIAGNGVIDMTGSTINMTNLGSSDFSFIAIGGQGNGIGDVYLENSNMIQSTPNQSSYFGLATDGGSGTVSLESSSIMSVSANDINAVIGDGNGATGTMTVDGGSNAAFLSTGQLDFEVGRSAGSMGTLTLMGGSQFDVAGTFGRVQIGSDSLTTTSGFGLVEVIDSTFDSTVGIQIGSAFSGPNNQTGEISLDNGTVKAPEIVIGTGGSLTGVGTVDTVKTVLSGGTISPGLSPGILGFTGDLELNSGSLLFEIGGASPSMFDSMVVGGNLFATDVFDIEISFINGFLPSVTDTFELFTFGSIDPSFFSFANFTSNAPVAFSSNGGSVSLSFDQIAPVPLPAGLPLLLTALGSVIFLRRNRLA